jgi:hypothetical protein
MKKTTFDSIKSPFLLVKEDFTDCEWKDLTVSLVEFDGTVQFETVYPDYIYNEAKKIMA